jgi:cellulose synthase/poly-beta-1,6-N-acetylglucosamine synthase-like glycosyltransferase
MKKISLVIPTWNEEGNIGPLVERINRALYFGNIAYEIIFIDDHSTDKTQIVIKQLAERYPIKLITKKGEPGKAQSLLEGFKHASNDIICMIDADLQYPPEAIPEMMQKLHDGVDMVVANRKVKRTNFLRSAISASYNLIFNKLLHGLDHDVQAGLKLFRKEIVQRLPLEGGKWAFDLSLLTLTKSAGYTIVNHDIEFAKRAQGTTKINLFKASWEIGMNAIKLKMSPKQIIPFHLSQVKKQGRGFHFKGQEYTHYSALADGNSAFFRVSRFQIFIIATILLDVSLGLLIDWHTTVTAILAVLTSLYFADLLFNLYLIVRSFSKPAEFKISKEELTTIPEQNWPSYTVFCPLYKEWQVVPQFVKSMSQLDYPKDKLQVMLLLESDDRETIEKIKAFDLPSYFTLVVVPNTLPKTKPKACNYGLLFATGDFSVIYDAEDVPDPLQLKKAVLAFQKAGNKTICVQAKLNFYNPNHNLLTRLFTAEYSLWFDLVLTGLQSIRGPIPLGGTSNHFRTRDLFKLKGWDSFNVTEDADLGIRLVKQGYSTAIVDSITLEEANSSPQNWFFQRSRWIKGYMQTYLVHTKTIESFLENKKFFHLVIFQLVIGGKILSMFINPLMWTITISYFALRPIIGEFIESFFPAPILYMAVFSLVVGNFLYVYYYMIGCAKHGHDQLIKYIYLVPFYWLAMSAAAWLALYKLITAPHHWSKTKHGIHLIDDKALTEQKAIGQDHGNRNLGKPSISLAY